ncbi:hypothetical protein A3A46_01705 [Candidatus Roizmanbacteria bacterium RIFCSPLOWO2_01_FULL_37_13]|uniref:Uncharacterized protein n=1 Tax=Candidatus Roizmanbacteria bacterium RIFCSPHIGHO2_02_FULL_38_11 TaxID=1802039 RepID=A0A1F7H0H9_9BACT|nr:MAG: hypothetical protein A3C25_05845 [Candidatus Roizmanbacteria bacterium RIFCSPHIGHO2_02_FULL_38_11]OGK34369.1 MAG: hypothetical protein A3F58_02725 [Candidatus Roizmanbacteria bacterium RIFCSPHIGHO2_12_FULL_37_9b]OGK42581.1 MAG: hypothetical protein A3A46_01705 [Candidatus Roizmanbacteria bacterium RIFCSPLOWO2_01_FULL_37_13]
MQKYSTGQLKTLSGYLSNLSLAWFSGGVIVPFFTNIDYLSKLTYNIIGLSLSYIFINIALSISKNLD